MNIFEKYCQGQITILIYRSTCWLSLWKLFVYFHPRTIQYYLSFLTIDIINAFRLNSNLLITIHNISAPAVDIFKKMFAEVVISLVLTACHCRRRSLKWFPDNFLQPREKVYCRFHTVKRVIWMFLQISMAFILYKEPFGCF